jgi:hypothetical protein
VLQIEAELDDDPDESRALIRKAIDRRYTMPA